MHTVTAPLLLGSAHVPPQVSKGGEDMKHLQQNSFQIYPVHDKNPSVIFIEKQTKWFFGHVVLSFSPSILFLHQTSANHSRRGGATCRTDTHNGPSAVNTQNTLSSGRNH